MPPARCMLHIACRSLRYAHRAVPTQHCDRKALRCAPYLCAHIARCLSLPPPLTPPCHPSLHPPIRVPPSLTPTHLSYHTLSGARRMDRCDRPHGAGYSRCARRRRHAPDLGVVGDVNQVARRRELRPAREAVPVHLHGRVGKAVTAVGYSRVLLPGNIYSDRPSHRNRRGREEVP